jgi:succinate dehydrogenase flavin-adding protein (antitoxin of CptAB toxin-antitoxin module)
MNPFAQDEGKELVDKTKLNVLLKLFNRNDWLLFNIYNNKLNAPNSDIKKDLKRLEEEQFCNTSIICGIIFRATFINMNNEPICPR